jgi:hypothetical protein
LYFRPLAGHWFFLYCHWRMVPGHVSRADSSMHAGTTRKHQSLFCDFRPVVSGPIFARMTLPSHPPSNPSSDIKIYFMRLSNKNEREKVCATRQ